MFEFGNYFDEAFARESNPNEPLAPVKPLRRRKPLRQLLTFWGANILLMPVVALIYLTIGAEGLRVSLSIFQLRLYKLPVPGAGLLRQYDGFDRLDLSHLMALILFVVVTFLWIRLFHELQSLGAIAQQRTRNPVLFYALVTICSIILLGDAGLFYVGLASQTSSSWSDTPVYVAPAATVLYFAGLALIGAWHADFAHSSNI